MINDAIQIHRAFRSNSDRVLVAVIHIPFSLIKNDKIKIYANLDIDTDYSNNKEDFELKDFIKKNDHYFLDNSALNLKGINAYELYIKKIPFNIKDNHKKGISQRFFLLDLYKLKQDKKEIKELREDLKTLKKNNYFLQGFFGDYNVFGRRHTEFLPSICYEVKNK